MGATAEAVITRMGGNWSVSVNGVSIESTTWLNIVSDLGVLGVNVITDAEANTTRFINNTLQQKRLRFEMIDASPVSISELNSNLTVGIDATTKAVTFCLDFATYF